MEIVKILNDGKSQTIRLPKDCHFSGDEVCVKKVGNMVVLYSKEHARETFIDGLNGFSNDLFSEGRNQGIQLPRDEL